MQLQFAIMYIHTSLSLSNLVHAAVYNYSVGPSIPNPCNVRQ